MKLIAAGGFGCH